MPQLPTPSQIAQLDQSLLLGQKRRPLSLPPAIAARLSANSNSPYPTIVALVLAGQYRRFQRPTTSVPDNSKESDQPLHDDLRPMLSEDSRRALKHLLSMVKELSVPDFANAALDEIDRHGLRLHPFDLPGLAPHLRSPEARRHAAVLPYLARVETANCILIEELEHMTPDMRGVQLQQLRKITPSAARDRVETLFASEGAEQRALLLEILIAELGPEDREFLEKAAKDRAGAVKDMAKLLLGRIPGAPEYDKRLSEAAAVLSVKTEGKLRRKRKLVFKVKDAGRARRHKAEVIVPALFGLLLGDLARQLDFTEDDFLALMTETELSIIVAFALTAADHGDCQQLKALTPLLSDSAAIDLMARHHGLKPMTEECRAVLTARFTAIATDGSLPHRNTLLSIYNHARAPLCEDLARSFLQSVSWREHVAELAKFEDTEKKPNALPEAALLIPTSLLSDYLASISEVSAHLTAAARAVVAFRHSLAATVPVSPIAQCSAEDWK